jgi:UDP-glucose 4-epimerase
MTKILITGGLGHLGSHFIEQFPLEYEIIVVDNLLTQRYTSLFNLNRPIKFIEKSIDELNIDDIAGVDYVLHLAAITDAAGSFKNKDQIEDTNLLQTEKFISLCKDNVRRFIFPSSTSVYGVAADPVYEDDDAFINPQSPYAESKIKIERLIKDTLGTNTKYLILRFGTIFGISKGMRFHTAINKFCYQTALDQPLTIWKDNYEQYRPYLGLHDAYRSIFHFLKADKDVWDKTYNVVSGNYRLSEVVETIKSVAGNVELNMVNTPLLNQYSYIVNSDKINETGFLPKSNLTLTIRDTLELLGNLK